VICEILGVRMGYYFFSSSSGSCWCVQLSSRRKHELMSSKQ